MSKKIIIVSDGIDTERIGGSLPVFNIPQINPHDCIGCWTCWWQTPGKCVFKDLNEFYHAYVTADKVVFLVKTVNGYLSGQLKTLFDRMIPLFLPYCVWTSGESRHLPRYNKYPDVEFYYSGDFEIGNVSCNDEKIFTDLIYRTFDQFSSKEVIVKPISQLSQAV